MNWTFLQSMPDVFNNLVTGTQPVHRVVKGRRSFVFYMLLIKIQHCTVAGGFCLADAWIFKRMV